MSEEEVHATIGRTIAERNEARRDLAVLNKWLSDVARDLTDLGAALADLPGARGDKFKEDLLLRKLRDLTEPGAAIIDRERIRAMVEECAAGAARLAELEEQLRRMGV